MIPVFFFNCVTLYDSIKRQSIVKQHYSYVILYERILYYNECFVHIIIYFSDSPPNFSYWNLIRTYMLFRSHDFRAIYFINIGVNVSIWTQNVHENVTILPSVLNVLPMFSIFAYHMFQTFVDIFSKPGCNFYLPYFNSMFVYTYVMFHRSQNVI